MNLEAAHPHVTPAVLQSLWLVLTVRQTLLPGQRPSAGAGAACASTASPYCTSMLVIIINNNNNSNKLPVVFFERPHTNGKVSMFRTSRRNVLLIEYCIPLEFMHEKDLST